MQMFIIEIELEWDQMIEVVLGYDNCSPDDRGSLIYKSYSYCKQFREFPNIMLQE